MTAHHTAGPAASPAAARGAWLARFAAALFVAVLAACAPTRGAQIAPLRGESIAVHDGDSFVLQAADGRKLGIRIAGIDAPEKGQPFADVSRRRLAELLRGRTLDVYPLKHDRYDRIVADVTVDGVDVGLVQLRAGLAWHYVRYAADQPPAQRREYAAAESQARERRLGLWAEPNPVEPWKYREIRRDPRIKRTAGIGIVEPLSR